MKKSIFAVAVTSALTLGAAQAETVLYGSIRSDYENKKESTLKAHRALGFNSQGQAVNRTQYRFSSKRLSNLEDAGSRIGIRGSDDLGNNIAIIYQLEWGFNGMEAGNSGSGFRNRLAILGLTGDWGTITAGRQNNPFKQTIVDDTVQDGFNGSNVSSNAGLRAMNSALLGLDLAAVGTYENSNGDIVHGSYGIVDGPSINTASNSRLGKAIAYVTPDIAGFKASAALMINGDLYRELSYNEGVVAGRNQQKTIDLWTINVRYNYDLGANGSILAKAGYINGKLADNNSSKMYGLFLGYIADQFSVTASFAAGDHTPQGARESSFTTPNGNTVHSFSNGAKNKYNGWDVGASFSFGANYYSTVRATYGENEIKRDGDDYLFIADSYNEGGKDKVKSWAVGFEQKLSPRTRAWLEYGAEETTYQQVNIDKKKDNVISVGMRHDF